jgi:hypothetical protein
VKHKRWFPRYAEAHLGLDRELSGALVSAFQFLTQSFALIFSDSRSYLLVTSVSGRYPGKAVAAGNVRRAAAAGEHQALACGLQRQIFGKTLLVASKFCVARSKARSFESMSVPYVNSPSICFDGGLTRRLVSGQFVSRRVIYASTNATKVIPDTSVSLDKSSSNF